MILVFDLVSSCFKVQSSFMTWTYKGMANMLQQIQLKIHIRRGLYTLPTMTQGLQP